MATLQGGRKHCTAFVIYYTALVKVYILSSLFLGALRGLGDLIVLGGIRGLRARYERRDCQRALVRVYAQAKIRDGGKG